jgi:hypothetical protein
LFSGVEEGVLLDEVLPLFTVPFPEEVRLFSCGAVACLLFSELVRLLLEMVEVVLSGVLSGLCGVTALPAERGVEVSESEPLVEEADEPGRVLVGVLLAAPPRIEVLLVRIEFS